MIEERNTEAEYAYYVAWESWRAAYDDAERTACEQEMDRLQPLIARSPADPRWRLFKDSLENYNEFWESIPETALRILNSPI